MDERSVDTLNLGSQPGDVQMHRFQEKYIIKDKTICYVIFLLRLYAPGKKGDTAFEIVQDIFVRYN